MSQFTSDEISIPPPTNPNPSCVEVHKAVGSLTAQLDAILANQQETKEKLDCIHRSVAPLRDFMWFVEPMNKFRNNIFWGVIKLFVILACLTIAIVNADRFITQFHAWLSK